jgi:hypothetical protein
MEAMRWIEITVDQRKNGVRTKNTSPLLIMLFRHEKYESV